MKELKKPYLYGLNPLGIGEGFELFGIIILKKIKCLNPLGIGEGFEPPTGVERAS